MASPMDTDRPIIVKAAGGAALIERIRLEERDGFLEHDDRFRRAALDRRSDAGLAAIPETDDELGACLPQR